MIRSRSQEEGEIGEEEGEISVAPTAAASTTTTTHPQALAGAVPPATTFESPRPPFRRPFPPAGSFRARSFSQGSGREGGRGGREGGRGRGGRWQGRGRFGSRPEPGFTRNMSESAFPDSFPPTAATRPMDPRNPPPPPLQADAAPSGEFHPTEARPSPFRPAPSFRGGGRGFTQRSNSFSNRTSQFAAQREQEPFRADGWMPERSFSSDKGDFPPTEVRPQRSDEFGRSFPQSTEGQVSRSEFSARQRPDEFGRTFSPAAPASGAAADTNSFRRSSFSQQDPGPVPSGGSDAPSNFRRATSFSQQDAVPGIPDTNSFRRSVSNAQQDPSPGGADLTNTYRRPGSFSLQDAVSGNQDTSNAYRRPNSFSQKDPASSGNVDPVSTYRRQGSFSQPDPILGGDAPGFRRPNNFPPPTENRRHSSYSSLADPSGGVSRAEFGGAERGSDFSGSRGGRGTSFLPSPNPRRRSFDPVSSPDRAVSSLENVPRPPLGIDNEERAESGEIEVLQRRSSDTNPVARRSSDQQDTTRGYGVDFARHQPPLQPQMQSQMKIATQPSQPTTKLEGLAVRLAEATHGRRPSDIQADGRGYQSEFVRQQQSLPPPPQPTVNRPPQRWDPRFPRPVVPAEDKPEVKKPTVSMLGENDISKGEGAVRKVAELMNEPALVSATRGESLLPDKATIKQAASKMDGIIERAQNDVDKAKAELEEIVKLEVAETIRQQQAAADEKKRCDEERRLQEKDRKEQERVAAKEAIEHRIQQRRDELTRRMMAFQTECEEERKEMIAGLHERLKKAKIDEKRRLKAEMLIQIERASESFDADVAKAGRIVQKILRDTASAETHAAKMEAELNSKVRESGIPHTSNEIVNITSVFSILEENKKKANVAHDDALSLLEAKSEGLGRIKDPQFGRTLNEWSAMTMKVTGRADALYTEPSDNPYYEKNEESHAKIGLLVKEYVREKNRKLKHRWSELAEEYLVRQQFYEKKSRRKISNREAISGSSKKQGRASILGMNNQADKPPSPIPDAASTPGARSSSTNPYRRARARGAPVTGDIVRSDYEQEQIIAEITAKELMEKRITHGGIRPQRQICKLERELNASFINTFESQKTLDPLQESYEQSITNVWTDMEKCIFLDRFLQHPKDFRKIASFLRNKSTRDCIAFYYISKQTVPYKSALKEHLMRRKRKENYQNWDATIEASLSCGAQVTAGTSEDKPIVISLPASDTSYHTFDLHPIRRKVLDRVNASGDDYDEDAYDDYLASKIKKRKRGPPLFQLEKKAQKFLKISTQEAFSGVKETREKVDQGERIPVARKIPQKWTASEKKLFHDIVKVHGKSWALLEEAIGTKSIGQIKNYYYDHKKQFGKQNSAVSDEQQARDVEIEIPRKKQITTTQDQGPVASNATNERLQQAIQPQADAQLDQNQNQHTNQASMENSNIDLQQQAIYELVARRAARDQSKSLSSDGQRTPEHEAVLLLQQQNEIYQQQAAQEEVRRLLQSQLGLSGLPSGLIPWTSQLAALQQQHHQQQHHHQQHQHQQHQHQQQQHQQQQHQQHQHQQQHHHQHHPQQHSHQQQHPHQQQHQQQPVQRGDSVRDYIDVHALQNALGLRQAGHHGFAMDPQFQLRSVLLGGVPGLNPMANAALLQQLESAAQHQDDRGLSGLGGSNNATADVLNVLQGLTSHQSPSTIAEALALLGRAAGRGDGGFPQDQHDQQRRDHY